LSLTPAVMDVLVCDDPLCEGVPLQISGIDAAVGTSSFMDSGPGNGKVLATGDGLPWIVEWEAGVEFYDGAGEIAGGPRMFFVAGTQEDAATGVGRGEVNLTPGALAIFLNAVAKMIPPSDITVPGDKVLGIPRGLPCGGNPSANYSPCGELPPLVIDNNVNTKYLNFGGNFDAGEEPSGFQVTPYNGASIVTGMTFTTANDAEPRDPVAFELYGSNVSIDGPYELIAAGEIVDFAQADAWPRFTKNETPIEFDNLMAYSHYRVLFTAIRDPASANSMQIAEVELLGVLVRPALVKINFQQAGGDIPSGYLPDYGEAFGDRGNGYSYGWSRDIQADARNRGSGNAPDERYDTLLHLQKGADAVWEIELPNGTYDVAMVCGDPDYTDQTNTFDVEGVVVEDPDGEDNFDEYALTVEVTDGLLTIQPAAGASNCKIMFVEVY